MEAALTLLFLLVVIGGASAADRVAAPLFSVSSSIVDGQTLTREVRWTATVSGIPTSDVASVVFTVDGATRSTEKFSPYIYGGDQGVLDTASLANGGHAFGVVATARDGTKATASVTATVSNPPRSRRRPTISGTALQGRTLSANRGSWTGQGPIGYAYRWLRCDPAGGSCAAISGAANRTYAVTAADVGHRLRVTVVASNGAGSTEATSSATSTVGSGAPANTSLPSISGTARDGTLLTAGTGRWTGNPRSYGYQWLRCDSNGSGCASIGGANSSRYTIATSDVGHRLRVVVTAANSSGSGSATSNPTDLVRVSGTAPASTAAPSISGAAQEGATLGADPGRWSGTGPIVYTYQWQRCDAGGGNCGDIAGAVSSGYRLTSADVAHTIRVDVTARNSAGSTLAATRQTAAVAPARAGSAVSVSQVSLPQRLVIDRVTFSPSPVRSRRSPVVARFHVSDTRGFSVQGALVYALGLPYGWVGNAPEASTDGAGWATVVLQPTARLPLRRGGALVVFVRARKPGDSLLAGISTRRLVQATVSR